MKKFLTLILSLFIAQISHSQPCEGNYWLNENFDSGIPSGWTVLNNDTNSVFWSLAGRGYTGSFQPFNHLGKKCLANTSNFSVPDTADDWLISPPITVGSAPVCLSWQAACMYDWAAESYQVMVSTTTPVPSSFLANAPLFTQTTEVRTWSQYSADLSAYTGQTIYLAIWYNKAAGWVAYFDDIRVTSPASKDASVKSINLQEILKPGSHPVKGSILNGGTTSITSLNVNWSVNSGAVNTISLTGLNIPPSAYYNYTHSVNWNPSSAGTYTLAVWTSAVNGGADLNTSNDTLKQITFVHSYPKKALIEEFTNADCPPCATQNPGLDALLGPNRLAGKVSMIKYHPMWPGANDPMYLFNPSDVIDRLLYYGSPGLPNIDLNGVFYDFPMYLTQQKIDSAYAEPSIFTMQVTNSITGGIMNIGVSIQALTNIPGTSLHLRTVVIEDTLIYLVPPGTNGEVDFLQTMRKMLPDGNGITLPPMTMNQVLNYNFSWPVTSPANPFQLRTVAFIQNDDNQHVYQSEITSSNVVGIENIEDYSEISVFPNPAKNILTLQTKFTNGSLELFNVNGKEVYASQINAPLTTLNIEKLPAGMYVLRVISAKGIFVRKIMKN